MSAPEKLEIKTTPDAVARLAGELAMPKEAAQQYAYAVKPSLIDLKMQAGQLVIEQLADKPFLEAIPID